jgi:hypothetical protein
MITIGALQHLLEINHCMRVANKFIDVKMQLSDQKENELNIPIRITESGEIHYYLNDATPS